MAARATRSASGAASSSDDASRYLLLALSHDELSVIFDGLADPLQPVVAVALSSTCLGLRTPLQAALLVLRQRHEKAKALCIKLGEAPSHARLGASYPLMTCAGLRDAEELNWQCTPDWQCTPNDLATLGLIMPWMPSLKELNFDFSRVGDTGMHEICGGLGRGAAPSLRQLACGDNQFGAAGAEALAAALRRGAMPKLAELHLGENVIGDQGVAALAPALKKLPALFHLDLGVCGIGDAGVASLFHNLGKDDFKLLEKLYLDANGLTDKGCATVVTALKAGALPAIRALRYPGSDDERISEFASEEACAAVDAALQQRLA